MQKGIVQNTTHPAAAAEPSSLKAVMLELMIARPYKFGSP